MSIPSDHGRIVCGESGGEQEVYEVEYGLGTTEFFVRLEHTVTTEVWSNTFTREYIEELTHKAGSFKELSVFYRMLAKGINAQDPHVVSIALYNQSDLQQLQRTKRLQASSSLGAYGEEGVEGESKFLVLTYRTEYDRVQYPLPLLYAGEPDPKALIKKIRRLQERHGARPVASRAPTTPAQQRGPAAPTTQATAKPHADTSPRKQLRRETDSAARSKTGRARTHQSNRGQHQEEVQDRDRRATVRHQRGAQHAPPAGVSVEDVQMLTQTVVGLREENKRLKRRLRTLETSTQRHASGAATGPAAAAASEVQGADDNQPSELNLLRQIVTNLEQDVLEQKNKFQRALQKKTEQIAALETELAAVQLSERNLRVKCRHLTGELAVRKSATGAARGGAGGTSTPRGRGRLGSGGGAGSGTRLTRSGSLTRAHRRGSPSGAGGVRATGTARRSRPGSQSPAGPRQARRRGSPSAGAASRTRKASATRSGVRSRSASPAPRFDPTAYVRAREEKLRAVRARREGKGSVSRGRSASPSNRSRRPTLSPGGPSNRKHSAGRPAPQRLRGRSKSAERATRPPRRDTSQSPRQQRAAAKRPSSARKREVAQNPDRGAHDQNQDRSYFKSASEIEDIDARLAALSQYLQRSH